MYLSCLKMVSLTLMLTFVGACGSGSSGKLVEEDYEGLVSVSGSIEVKADTSVDLDVKQRCSELFGLNNAFADAQQVSNPLTIGGYLNGTYQNDGDCDVFEEDLADIFRVSLVEGQSVSISVFAADSTSAPASLSIDLTLSLRLVSDEETSLEELAISELGAQSLTVPQTAEYYVRIGSVSGADPVLYTLSLSQSLSDSDALLFSKAVSDDFVPGDVLLALKPDALDSAASLQRSATGLPESIGEQFGLVLNGKVGDASSHFKIKSQLAAQRFRVAPSATLNEPSTLEKKWQTLAKIEQLRKDDRVLFAEPNYLRQAAFIPNDTFYNQQWSLPLLNLPAAWDQSTGENVIVAVIDSGINLTHPDLANQLVSNSGYDFISDSDDSGDGDGYDADPSDLSETHHGSHVAGIIAAQTGNNAGVSGLAYNAKLMPLRVLGVENDEGVSQGSDADLANAILYAAGIENASGQLPVQRADIINLSLGGSGHSDVLNTAINAAIAKGIIVIAAAGNEASNSKFYPAAFDGVVAVSSVTSQLSLSGFSNYGDYIDVAAPGGSASGQEPGNEQRGILSTTSGDSYQEYLGTSMASPHVAGVAALMKSIKPELNASSFSYALENGHLTDIIGESTYFGNGVINAEKAVNWASGADNIPDSLYFFPKYFSFLNASINASLYLSNPGSGSVRITAVGPSEDDADWVSVVQDSVNSEGLGSYSVEVNSAAIPVNTFRKGTIKISYRLNDSAVQSETIDVLASNTISGNESVGDLYISIISLDNVNNHVVGDPLEAQAVVAGSLVDGHYEYEFVNLPQGEYFIRASTNNDGDQYIFDEGEARGIYPSFSKFETVVANKETVSGIDFSVQFYESDLEATSAIYNANDLSKPN